MDGDNGEHSDGDRDAEGEQDFSVDPQLLFADTENWGEMDDDTMNLASRPQLSEAELKAKHVYIVHHEVGCNVVYTPAIREIDAHNLSRQLYQVVGAKDGI